MIIPAKSQFNWLGGFWKEDFLNFSQWEHIMDPGSHVGFQISTNLAEDHEMNISGKFGWNPFSGFREEDLNVKSYRTDAYPWQKLTWPMATWAKNRVVLRLHLSNLINDYSSHSNDTFNRQASLTDYLVFKQYFMEKLKSSWLN